MELWNFTSIGKAEIQGVHVMKSPFWCKNGTALYDGIEASESG